MTVNLCCPFLKRGSFLSKSTYSIVSVLMSSLLVKFAQPTRNKKTQICNKYNRNINIFVKYFKILLWRILNSTVKNSLATLQLITPSWPIHLFSKHFLIRLLNTLSNLGPNWASVRPDLLGLLRPIGPAQYSHIRQTEIGIYTRLHLVVVACCKLLYKVYGCMKKDVAPFLKFYFTKLFLTWSGLFMIFFAYMSSINYVVS